MITTATVLRVARPTDNLEDVVRFYTEGLGLHVIDSFEDHDGFEGVMIGLQGAPYHLEFTRKQGETVGRAPTEDNLIVFYLPDTQVWHSVNDRMVSGGYEPVAAYNPYWDENGRTYEDPDGYRVVLQHSDWTT